MPNKHVSSTTTEEVAYYRCVLTKAILLFITHGNNKVFSSGMECFVTGRKIGLQTITGDLEFVIYTTITITIAIFYLLPIHIIIRLSVCPEKYSTSRWSSELKSGIQLDI